MKPKLLGTYLEYMNRFANPITNGQYHDSTPADIKIMKYRSHVLHKLLKSTVQVGSKVIFALISCTVLLVF